MDFINDTDKMYDFLGLTREEFLKSYSYITQEEYQETFDKFIDDTTGVLADLMRESENLLLEENNGRDTGCNTTGEQLKTRVADYVYTNLRKAEIQEFEDLCSAMAC